MAPSTAADKPLEHCPYTGDRFRVMQNVDGLYVSGGLNPAGWVKDRAELERQLRRRNGREGAHRGPLVCPYTGNEITIVQHEGTGCYRANGAWSPIGKLWTWRSQLMYDISYRDGVAPAFEREPPTLDVEDRGAPQSSDPSENWGAAQVGGTKEISDRIIENIAKSD